MEPAPRNHDHALRSRGRRPVSRLLDDEASGPPDRPDTACVVATARRLLRDREISRALELLATAIRARPGDERLWVAQLEVIALTGTQARFLRTMREFLDVHPDPARLDDIVHLWKRLSPG